VVHEFAKFFNGAKQLPQPARPALAEVGMERWLALADKEGDSFYRQLAECDEGRLLKAIFGNSPFLTQSMLREPDFVRRIVTVGVEESTKALLGELENELGQEQNLTALMSGLRRAKRKIAIVVALADIAGHWSLEQVTETLSRFADTATNIAIRFGLRHFAADGAISFASNGEPDHAPERRAGYAIIGVGKLGANELNYSSDIDLIALFDPSRRNIEESENLGREMVRLTRLIIKILEERTEDGYVFRTDFRIRPDPGSTPLAIPIDSAVAYYESTGQNWERLAMIRARPIAGDIEVGEQFLERIQPFIWRKNLDFAAIQDIHSVKRQIAAYRGGGKIAINGHNIKVGRGGIREIEFFAQTQQLIWGGRIPTLRTRGLAETLTVLANENRIEPDVASDLEEAYQFLRLVEHRLQMVDDRQTHELPKGDEEVEAIGKFAGFKTLEDFRKKLLQTLETVEANYAVLFEESENLGAGGNLVFTGVEDDPDTLESLRRVGFSDPESISEVVRNWHRGRYRATRTERARQILTELMPSLLTTFGARTHPDRALMRFDAFLRALPSGVQLLSLFASSQPVLDLVADIMGDAPALADWLSRNPGLLDHVLSEGFNEPLGDVETLSAELSSNIQRGRDFQDKLDVARRWANDKKFQIGTQLLLGSVKGRDSGPLLSDIAETILKAMLKCVSTEFADTHGVFETGGLGLMAYGKLGGRELMRGSDLDLVFIYDHAPEENQSNGAKPLSANVYFMRLAQRMITALTALTGEGRLYDVDTRLRPNGEKGPIAASYASFERYYRDSAWTWEYMALSRARVVAGPRSLVDKLEAMQKSELTRPRDAEELTVDVAKMRNRMAKQFPGTGSWDIKHLRGGLVDAEFIAQYLQLRHGSQNPGILSPTAAIALQNLEENGLLDEVTADELIEGLWFWYDLQSVLRITTEEGLEDESRNSGPREILAQAGGVPSFGALTEKMQTTADTIYSHFETLIEKPGRNTGNGA